MRKEGKKLSLKMLRLEERRKETVLTDLFHKDRKEWRKEGKKPSSQMLRMEAKAMAEKSKGECNFVTLSFGSKEGGERKGE